MLFSVLFDDFYSCSGTALSVRAFFIPGEHWRMCLVDNSQGLEVEKKGKDRSWRTIIGNPIDATILIESL